MEKGFNRAAFMEYMQENFNMNRFSIDLIDNIIEYGYKHEMVSKDMFAEWLSDMIPEVEFLEVAKFMEDGHLTNNTLERLGRI